MAHIARTSMIKGHKVIMPSPQSRSEIKTHLLGRLEALLDDCDQVADQSTFGQTFNNLEKFFRTKGQTFWQGERFPIVGVCSCFFF